LINFHHHSGNDLVGHALLLKLDGRVIRHGKLASLCRDHVHNYVFAEAGLDHLHHRIVRQGCLSEILTIGSKCMGYRAGKEL